MEFSTLSLSDERIMYEAIFRHIEHLARIDCAATDTVAAAKLAADAFPKLGYPVPHWVAELAHSTVVS